MRNFRDISLNIKHSLSISEKRMDNGLLEWYVGLAVYLLFPLKALFHAEKGDDSNREECKASLGFKRFV